MQFTVPKFLERESVIAFGLTFKKLAAMGGLGLVLVVLYYIVPRGVFIAVAIVFALGFVVAVFVKIDGVGLPEIVQHSFGFFVSSRVYIWDKKRSQSPIQFVKKKAQAEEAHKEATLKISPSSQLRGVGAKIEMGKL